MVISSLGTYYLLMSMHMHLLDTRENNASFLTSCPCYGTSMRTNVTLCNSNMSKPVQNQCQRDTVDTSLPNCFTVYCLGSRDPPPYVDEGRVESLGRRRVARIHIVCWAGIIYAGRRVWLNKHSLIYMHRCDSRNVLASRI